MFRNWHEPASFSRWKLMSAYSEGPTNITLRWAATSLGEPQSSELKGRWSPWPLQDRAVCCQWASLPHLTFWRGNISLIFTSGFPCKAGPKQNRSLNYSSACCQLLVYLCLTVLLTSHRRESVSGQDCQLQWSLCVPSWREEQGSFIPARWLSALYCCSLVPDTNRDQRISKRVFPSLSLLFELLLSFHFQFCNTELPLFLAGMQLVLYTMFEEKAGKCKLREVILLLWN